MSLLDRISKVGTVRAVEIDGLTFHVKTKNIMQQAEFADDIKAAAKAKSEIEGVNQFIKVLSENIESIDEQGNVEKFLQSVPSVIDLSVIAFDIGKAMTEKESKNYSSPSESPSSTVDVQKVANQEITAAQKLPPKKG